MRTLFLYITFLTLPFGLSAQWNAFITNYKKEAFGRGSKTWQIRGYDKNHIFFGNTKGVLAYNGTDWNLLPLHNGNDARSVCVSKQQNRIYAGGENEFGYFGLQPDGLFDYTNLSEACIADYHLTGGYWGVYEVDNLIYYVSDRHIVKQVGDEFIPIYTDVKIDCSNIVNGILYVGTTDGVKMLVGNTLLPVPNDDWLTGKTVRAIVPYESGYLVATAFDGLFYGTEHDIVPFSTGAERFMRQNEVFSLAVSPTYIGVGSIRKGLALIDRRNNRISYYNEQNGLQNNTILSLFFDDQENLWLGLDNGIDYITLDSPYTNLYTYPNTYGAGYASLSDGDFLYLGTNRGLYYTKAPIVLEEDPPEFHLVTGLSGQVWGLRKVGGDIFCLHEKGLYLVKPDGITSIAGLRGALNCIQIPDDPDKCLIGTYEGLFVIRRKQGKWSVLKKLTEVASSWAKNFVFIPPATIWIRAVDEGVVRAELDKRDYSITEYQSYGVRDGFDSIENLYVHEINGMPCFSSASGLYSYDRLNDRIVAADRPLNSLLAGKSYMNITAKGDHVFALSPDMIQKIRLLPDGTVSEAAVFPFSRSQIEFIQYYESMEVLSDSMVIIPNENGFALLNMGIPYKEAEKELFIKHVYITYPKDSVIYTNNFLNTVSESKIPYHEHALRFEYGVRSFGSDIPVQYRVRLMPDDRWSEYSQAMVKEYNNLGEGNYRFEAEALFGDGSLSSASYAFTILPPWYRSVYAWIGYCILFVLLLLLLYRIEERRIIRNSRAETLKKEEEMQLREEQFKEESLVKEQEIIRLRNEKLEQELAFKSQEIANLMINFSRKNETLMFIKQELFKVTSELKGEGMVKAKRMLVTLNNSIDSNIESDDLLKRFEEQFDLVHNNFMKKLRERHPDLSMSELKMCAYIKMNLSSKEIAPLLNLSLRGTETLRYRLRKKIGLEREDSLTDYLNKISQ